MITDILAYLGALIFIWMMWFLLWLMLCIIHEWWKGLSGYVNSLSKDEQELRRDKGEEDD